MLNHLKIRILFFYQHKQVKNKMYLLTFTNMRRHFKIQCITVYKYFMSPSILKYQITF